jgi:hypothetical protein
VIPETEDRRRPGEAASLEWRLLPGGTATRGGSYSAGASLRRLARSLRISAESSVHRAAALRIGAAPHMRCGELRIAITHLLASRG